jgi:hypothetical protein
MRLAGNLGPPGVPSNPLGCSRIAHIGCGSSGARLVIGPFWSVLSEQLRRLLDLLGGRLPHEVGINLPRYLRACMPQDHLHDFDRNAARNEK